VIIQTPEKVIPLLSGFLEHYQVLLNNFISKSFLWILGLLKKVKGKLIKIKLALLIT
jgi:hypothetical protein